MPPHRARDAFDVQMLTQPAGDEVPTPGITLGATLGRMLLSKMYQGESQATARGRMLSALTPTTGSAG